MGHEYRVLGFRVGFRVCRVYGGLNNCPYYFGAWKKGPVLIDIKAPTRPVLGGIWVRGAMKRSRSLPVPGFSA